MAVSAKKTVMTMYSGEVCPYSHRARIVLAEKHITADITWVGEQSAMPEDVMALNPYNSLPTLVDRELVLYHSRVIMEYLDERYPHPPLLPVDPVNRAQTRMFLYRIERDWYSLLDALTGKDKAKATRARAVLRDGLISVAPIFEQKSYFMSDDFSLVDCSLVPILWRLPAYGIALPAEAKPLLDYADRLFERESFQESLTEAEREIRL